MQLTMTRPVGVTTGKTSGPLVGLQAQLFREHGAPGPAPGLMAWVLDRRNVEAARDRVLSADGAVTAGVDGVTGENVRRLGSRWLAEVGDELFRRAYRPAPPRWLDIPKPNKPGQVRRLGVLTIRDRVVLTAIKQVLEPLLEPTFAATSFGFRPGRSVPLALAEACRLLTPGRWAEAFAFAAHVDVADCFDTIDHEHLRAALARRIADAELMALLDAFLLAGGTLHRRWFSKRMRGIVQGSSLSPLLCNLALHPLDQTVCEADGAVALRYADDLLVLSRDARSGDRAIAALAKTLGTMHQRFRHGATRVAPAARGVDWLGVTIRPRVRPWSEKTEYGYETPARKVAEMLKRLTEMTAPPNDRIDSSAFNPGRWVVSINEQLRDWRQAYQFADNAPEVFRALDEHARERVGDLLRALTGKRRAQLVREHRVKLPRGFWSWQAGGMRLTVLSSLAANAPVLYARRPEWMRCEPAKTEKPEAAAQTDADTGE